MNHVIRGRSYVAVLALGVLSFQTLHAAESPKPKIQLLSSTTSTYAPFAVQVAAFPSIQTMPANCGRTAAGESLEHADYSVFKNWSEAQRAELARCIRARDKAFEKYLSETFLGGGDPSLATLEWDFGNPAGRYNKVRGFNASHVYEKPGTYTVRLTITNEFGLSSSTTTTVTLGGAVRPAVYVDAVAGSDQNNGASPTSPVKSLERAIQLSCGKDVFFKRGQVFSAGPDKQFSLCSDTRLSAYGTGEKPILEAHRKNVGYYSLFTVFQSTVNVLIEDLHIRQRAGTPDAIFLNMFGRNTVVRRSDFSNINSILTVRETAAGKRSSILEDDPSQRSSGPPTV